MTTEEIKVFMQALLAELTGYTVIFQQQNAPKPAKPYLTIRLFAFRANGIDELRPSNDHDVFMVTGSRECTCEVHWVGNGGLDGLRSLEQSLQRPTIVDKCVATGLAIFNAEEIQDISGLLDGTEWEHRHTIDLHLRTMRQTADKTMHIADLEITGFADERPQAIAVKTSD